MSHNATIVQYYIEQNYIEQIKNNDKNLAKSVKSINNKSNTINFIDIIYNKIKNINKSNDKSIDKLIDNNPKQ